ncbi:uncharacterized protein TRIADDRAFT_29327, partial [Trichoplax adhaerens]
GAATNFITRSQAVRKLQLSLADFRRLCILKGIYPHEPKNKKKVSGGDTAFRTYYYIKDIKYLAHEPIINKFRDHKIFVRKLRRAIGRKEDDIASKLNENKPVYTLDHIVKERYPSFIDALRDLDDAISMLFLFSSMPQTSKIQATEFMHYVIQSRSLRKVFLSIKGIYYQVELQGQNVTWIVPYKFSEQVPYDVDFRVMLTFLEFYITLLGFVNFQLYHSINLKYPPQLVRDRAALNHVAVENYCMSDELEDEILIALNQDITKFESAESDTPEIDEFPIDEDATQMKEKMEEEKKFSKLFEGLKFFLSREVPQEALVFVIRCFGGQISWDSLTSIGASYEETDESITHQIVDRPSQKHQFLSRYYVQPQWVFDCVNARTLLSEVEYLAGIVLPPHLSPFVVEEEGDYVPPERRQLLNQTSEEVEIEEENKGTHP